MSSDLVAFVRARLDDDETLAKDERVWFGPYPATIDEFEGWLVIQEERVLREVEAKRVILSHHDSQHDCGDVDSWQWPYTGCWDVRALAAIWRNHPDYRPEWKPSDE